uniref:Sulfotransferase n=1 Tax=Tetraselmis sp. GSL018 TaxID=582737 RepID=A0A061RTW1_9CHLO
MSDRIVRIAVLYFSVAVCHFASCARRIDTSAPRTTDAAAGKGSSHLEILSRAQHSLSTFQSGQRVPFRSSAKWFPHLQPNMVFSKKTSENTDSPSAEEESLQNHLTTYRHEENEGWRTIHLPRFRWSFGTEHPPKLPGVKLSATGLQKTVSQLESSAPLPSEQDLRRLREELNQSCGRRDTKLQPPSLITVSGLPNSGTNALSKLLKSNLAVDSNDCVPGLWKHLVPFHPLFQQRINDSCLEDLGYTVYIFTLRHPLAWLQSQTSSGHGFGHICHSQELRNETFCTFNTCHIGDEFRNCSHVPKPRSYKFATLLDLWSAYSRSVFNSTTTLVVRYEDLLASPLAVLSHVASYFNVGLVNDYTDMLQNYSRPFDCKPSSTGIKESQRRWHRFNEFWNQFPSYQRLNQFNSTAFSALLKTVSCGPDEDLQHLLINPNNAKAVNSALRNGRLQKAARLGNYFLPAFESLGYAWDACSASHEKSR